MNTAPSVAQRLTAYWRDLGLPISSGCSESAVRQFEASVGAPLPADMRTYLLTVNGMRDAFPGDQDKEGFSFWPLARVRWLPKELAEVSPHTPVFRGAEKFYAFADYLTWSWAYAIRLTGSGKVNQVVLVGKEVAELVADSFAEFVDLYLIDSPALYAAPPLIELP
jgi:cell wall assembly regulator SMI1